VDDRIADAASPGGPRLESWKEIAAYLKRDVTTVQRWEKREGLPVHRHSHLKRDSIYAFAQEIDAWRASRRNGLPENGTPEGEAKREPPQQRSIGPVSAGDPARLDRRRIWGMAAVCAIVAAAGGGAALFVVDRREDAGHNREIRFSIAPPADLRIGSLAVSPDGRLLAFTAAEPDGEAAVWIRPLRSLDARPLQGTEGASFPFWSSDSRQIAFFAQGKLKRVALDAGDPFVVTDAPARRGGAWSATDEIVFSPGRYHGLFRVSAAGGTARPLTTVDRPASAATCGRNSCRMAVASFTSPTAASRSTTASTSAPSIRPIAHGSWPSIRAWPTRRDA
jgi:hypothetical protein